DLGGVAQAARTQLDVLETFAIGAQSGVVVYATLHESPMAGLDLAMSGLLEIEDVDGAGRVSNDVGSFLGVLGEGSLTDDGGDSAERSHIRACGQKLEKF